MTDTVPEKPKTWLIDTGYFITLQCEGVIHFWENDTGGWTEKIHRAEKFVGRDYAIRFANHFAIDLNKAQVESFSRNNHYDWLDSKGYKVG